MDRHHVAHGECVGGDDSIMKSRKAAKEHCSFCGHHRDDEEVPTLITSGIEDAACCLRCALTIVYQSVEKAEGIYKGLLAARKAPPTHVDTSSSVQEAVKQAINDND